MGLFAGDRSSWWAEIAKGDHHIGMRLDDGTGFLT
jgi:hypothetical protein